MGLLIHQFSRLNKVLFYLQYNNQSIADYTNIFVIGKTEDEAYQKANNVLQAIYNYMRSNLLHINLTKAVYMHFRPGKYSSCARARAFGSEKALSLDGYKLSKVDKVRFLGVITDSELSWDQHIEYLRDKLNASIAVMKRIMKFIPKSECHKIYNSLIKSHLSYCISCWGGVPQYSLSSLFAFRKGVSVFYSVRNQTLIMESSMKLVLELDLMLKIRPRKIMC
jgi:hypothetical protein